MAGVLISGSASDIIPPGARAQTAAPPLTDAAACATIATMKSSLLPCLLLLGGCLMPLHAKTAPAPLVTCDLTPLLHQNTGALSDRRRVWDTLHFISALQGLANRDKSQLYVYLVGPDAKYDRYWLGKLRAPGQWLAGRNLVPEADPLALLTRFRKSVRGAVVWDERIPATSDVASTVAGADGLLPLRFDPAPGSLYWRCVLDPRGPRLSVKVRLLRADGGALFTGRGAVPGTRQPSSGSAKCDAYLWAMEKYLKTGKCDPTRLAYYPDAFWLAHPNKVPADRTLLCNHDYFIAHKGFFFDLGPWDDEAPNDDPRQPLGADLRTLQAVLRAAYDRTQTLAKPSPMIHVGGFTPWDQKYTDFTGGKHGGVPTEWRYAEILSCFNAYMDADAPSLHAMANASVFQHFPLQASYPQPNLPTDTTLRILGYLDAQGRVAPRNYAAIYVGDYDSAAWLYQRLPDLWDDPARGTVPLGWAFNPTLDARFPVGLAYTRRTATPADTFLTGDSGAGYLNPGLLTPPRRWSGLPSGLASWEAHCRREYARWGLTVTGFVIDGDAPPMSDDTKRALARFSPGGVVAQKIPERSLVDGVPFLRMGADLNNPTDGAQKIAAAFPAPPAGVMPTSPAFHIFRTILWSPSSHREMRDALKRARPDIEWVDPHVLFLLLRHALGGKQD